MKVRKCALFVICLLLVLSLSACERSIYEKREAAFNDGYDVGYIEGEWDGFDNGYDEGHSEGYKEGFDEAYYSFEAIALHDAARYAEKHGGWHPEEAMEIIDAYENDELAFGKMRVTEQDYKKAVKSLYLYYEYFYNGLYHDKMNN